MRRYPVVWLFFAALAPVAARAQVVLATLDGSAPNAHFGQAVAGVGDVDVDGFDDVAVSAPLQGKVQVFSGRDRSLLLTLSDTAGIQAFGAALAGVGDIDGDGRPDVFVGDYADATHGANTGAARLYSGLDGSVIYRYVGEGASSLLGWAVDAAGDVDADGWPDLIAGAIGGTFQGNGGRAFVWSGRTGALLHTFVGAAPTDRLGDSVSGAGDLDLDGHDDLLVGATQLGGWPQRGKVEAYSGVDGSLLYRIEGNDHQYAFGRTVEGLDDLDLDGRPDFAVGCTATYFASASTGIHTNVGSVRVFSGRDGAELYELRGGAAGDLFGGALASLSDLDGDGRGEIAVGAAPFISGSNGSRGYVQVFSGVAGTLLYTLQEDDFYDGFGRSVDAAGDVDGDGRPDLIVGIPFDDDAGQQAGRARLFSGTCPPPPNIYCTAAPNSVGAGAHISWTGSTGLAANDFVLHVSGGPPGNPAVCFYGPSAIEVPFGQGYLCVSGPNGAALCGPPTTLDANGTSSFALDLDAAPFASGLYAIEALSTWRFQCWYRDRVGGATGFDTTNLSDALSTALCP